MTISRLPYDFCLSALLILVTILRAKENGLHDANKKTPVKAFPLPESHVLKGFPRPFPSPSPTSNSFNRSNHSEDLSVAMDEIGLEGIYRDTMFVSLRMTAYHMMNTPEEKRSHLIRCGFFCT
jgi:hypothetical protein